MAEPQATAPQTPIEARSVSAAAHPGTHRWRFIKRLAIIAGAVIVGVYAVWWITLYSLQDNLLFPLTQLPAPSKAPRFPGTTPLKIVLEDGGEVHAWLIRAPGASQAQPAPLVVYFHGNAELIDYLDDIVATYWKWGCNILLPEYRGYGHSAGKPSQAAIREDFKEFFDWAVKQPEVDPTRVIYHGRSVGAAVAVDVATYRKPRAIILESTFTSMTDMAHELMAPGFLVKNPFPTDEVLPMLDVPSLILHGTRDDIIRVSHGRTLHALTPGSEYIEFDAGHNDFPGKGRLGEYWGGIRQFLLARHLVPAEMPAWPDKQQTNGASTEVGNHAATAPAGPVRLGEAATTAPAPATSPVTE